MNYMTGKADTNIERFKHWMKTVWFGLYPRINPILGSSGFEHVFLGEFKAGISGLHSWLRFYQLEVENHINYLGYIKKIDMPPVSITT